jgi:hypothetical protein
MMIIAFALAVLGLTACTTDADHPELFPDDRVDRHAPVMPVEGFNMWPTPTIDDSELEGEYYAYVYWHAHKSEAQTGDELMAMCNVPDDILKNMSTANLVRTCFKHPYLNTWNAYNNAYDGILSVITRFNGFQELMKRLGGAEATLNLFTELGYQLGTTIVSETDMISWTLVMCTAADYCAFSREQVARLAQDVRNKDRIALLSSYPDRYLSHNFYCLLGAFIAYHYDYELPEEQRVLLASFIKFRCTNFYGDDENLGRSYTIICSSLDRLAESENESNQQ